MGTTVIGGMLAATIIAIFLIPVTYYVVELIGLALIVWLTQREQALALVPASNFLKRDTCLRIIQQNVDLAFAESSQ